MPLLQISDRGEIKLAIPSHLLDFSDDHAIALLTLDPDSTLALGDFLALTERVWRS